MNKLICIIFMTLVISINQSEISNRCQCLEYWQCLRGGGTFTNYCGLSESRVCCHTPRSNVTNVRSLQTKCGQKGKDTGKIGFAELTEWPWHVALLEKANHIYICGASLIDENWVLTAAHCVEQFAQGVRVGLSARLGEYDVRSSVEFYRHEDADVSEIIIHPKYNNKSLKNDIALLHLRFPVLVKPNIDVVCVPKIGFDFYSKQNCFVTGWGRLHLTSRHSEVLKEVQVPIWPTQRCEYILKQHFGDNYTLSNSLLCAGDEGSDACDGDGGGPLVCEDTGQWYQVGIVSFGLGCGEKDTPGVYTNLVEFEYWITHIIQSKINK